MLYIVCQLFFTTFLLGLAVADLASLVTMFWSSICYNPLFGHSGIPFDSIDVTYLTGGWPHACFNRYVNDSLRIFQYIY